MNKKILITGGAGYIGSHTVHHLINNGIDSDEIIVLDNLSQGHRSFIPDGVEFAYGDLRNLSDVYNIFRKNEIDAVIHFAGSAYVGESMVIPAKYFENNVSATINLLNAMVNSSCRKIVFSSTCAIYGTQHKPTIDESHPQEPINPYGESKLIIEKMLDWYGISYGIKSISLRYFNASGAAHGIGESHDPETHIIPLIFQAAIAGNPVKIFGSDYPTPDGTCIRDYIHVQDLAHAHLLAVKHLGEMNSTRDFFNLGAQMGISLLQLLDIASSISGIKIKHEISPRRAGDPPFLVANSNKAKNVLGWEAKKDIHEIIDSAWTWFRLNNPK